MKSVDFFSLNHFFALGDVVYFGFLYFTFGILCSCGINRLSNYFFDQDNSNKSSIKIIIEIYIELTLLLLAYHFYGHHLIGNMKPPLHTLYNYDIGEKSNTIISAFSIFIGMESLKNKITFLIKDRFRLIDQL
jgi:hypothetical protein